MGLARRFRRIQIAQTTYGLIVGAALDRLRDARILRARRRFLFRMG
jgi:hypothetical protein